MPTSLPFRILLIIVTCAATPPAQVDKVWWSLQPMRNSAIPEVDSTWIRTEVDAFVLRRLRAGGLTPAPEADRRTLIRRLTFDLHGLPPTPAEIEAYKADRRPDAYERLVDRLLASPRYGERWARHWLDVVHYGETHGYDKDKLRPNAWPYRDWVIRAFNEDKPYARFVREQLAGDVLYPGTEDGIIALGFIATGPWDFVAHVELREGTIDKAITRLLDRDDMVMTTMSSFVSTTAHCARCHDHKFDPIPSSDYYSLQAVFAGVERADRVYRASPMSALLTSDAGTLGYHSAIAKSRDVTKWVQVDLGESRAIDAILLLPAHVEYGGHPGPGFGFPARFRIEVSNDPTFATARVIADRTGDDYQNPGDSPQRFPCRGTPARHVRVTATRLFERTDDWIFALGELIALSGGKNVAAAGAVTALDSIEAGSSWGKSFLTDGAAPRDEKRVYAAATVFRPNGQFKPPGRPRPIHLLARGDVSRPGPLMKPGALTCLPRLAHHFAIDDPGHEGQRRAALARWITDPENPLTWRSIVNRVWQYHFTRGLVDTPNDFGRMGAKPTHPELLDWLAVWFRDRGGSWKQLHRLLLRSAVYRQSSARRDGEVAKRDANNTLLWRMSRRRLEAEEIRDSVLAVSGKLDLTMGGPSQRWFEFKDDHSPHYDYRAFDPDTPGANRRSIYRHIVRSVPDPLLECLDGADASTLTPKRYSTLTALQALALLNDPFLLRQAEHFAARLRDLAKGPEARAAAAFRLALGRRPTDEESRVLAQHARRHGMANLCRLIFNLNEFVFVD